MGKSRLSGPATSALALCAGGLCALPAQAFTVENLIAHGCHEHITSAALRAVRSDTPSAAPLPADADEQALIGDMQFTPDPDMTDLGGATLLLAVRDNDLKGRSSDDLTELPQVHGDPSNQEEHCLRSADQQEPGGSAAAIAACRAFILQRVSEALGGLDAGATPDSSLRTSLTIYLSLRGQVDASLPTYYVRMGQALHALQDSFSHTYRTLDGGTEVTVALNWVAIVNGNLDESRDGPPHTAALDVCDDPDALRAQRHALAIQATTDLLHATLDPATTPDQKLSAAGAILDTYLTFSPGCTFDNQWCGAPEHAYKPSSAVCGSAPGPVGYPVALMALLVVGAWVRRRPQIRRSAAALFVVATLLVGVKARADANTAPPVPVPRSPWGVSAELSAALDNPALSGGVGGRWRLSRHWIFGLDGEWNPWISLNNRDLHRGVLNFYATAFFRLPLEHEVLGVRTSASFGTSYLLTNLYGAPSGSVGFFAALAPFGLEWQLSKSLQAILAPTIAVPIPQLHGIPLAYSQYRLSLSFEHFFW